MTTATQASACPWCDGTSLARARFDCEATELYCDGCKMRHTLKQGGPTPYAFFPPDIQAILVSDIPKPC